MSILDKFKLSHQFWQENLCYWSTILKQYLLAEYFKSWPVSGRYLRIFSLDFFLVTSDSKESQARAGELVPTDTGIIQPVPGCTPCDGDISR